MKWMQQRLSLPEEKMQKRGIKRLPPGECRQGTMSIRYCRGAISGFSVFGEASLYFPLCLLIFSEPRCSNIEVDRKRVGSFFVLGKGARRRAKKGMFLEIFFILD
jgi:hypothetical protein